MNAKLRAALADLWLPPLTWYQATRHSFASQWVLAGGSIEQLREILGHARMTTTERYAHLRVDLFPERDLGSIRLDLTSGGGNPVQLSTERAPTAVEAV